MTALLASVLDSWAQFENKQFLVTVRFAKRHEQFFSHASSTSKICLRAWKSIAFHFDLSVSAASALSRWKRTPSRADQLQTGNQWCVSADVNADKSEKPLRCRSEIEKCSKLIFCGQASKGSVCRAPFSSKIPLIFVCNYHFEVMTAILKKYYFCLMSSSQQRGKAIQKKIIIPVNAFGKRIAK